jgi:hypothetical protein
MNAAQDIIENWQKQTRLVQSGLQFKKQKFKQCQHDTYMPIQTYIHTYIYVIYGNIASSVIWQFLSEILDEFNKPKNLKF